MDLSGTVAWSAARRLYWKDIEVGAASYHAALFAGESTPGFRIAAHRHDFFEMMLVVEGAGYHPLAPPQAPPRTDPLAAGDLLFLRPDDCHALAVPSGGRLHWINIAFPAASWEAFRAAADLPPGEWDGATLPRRVHLAQPEAHRACLSLFQGVLQRFQSARAQRAQLAVPDRLELCGFLAGAVRFLRPGGEERVESPGVEHGPPWLRRACHALEREIDREAAGTVIADAGRFAALAGVSPAHLARTLKAVTGRTPTEYINERRLTRAALLLTTTARPILEIAADCGFSQLSYFYRLFRRRFGIPPDAYRRAALAPLTG